MLTCNLLLRTFFNISWELTGIFCGSFGYLLSSKTARVFQAIHQNIIFTGSLICQSFPHGLGIYALKTHLPISSKILTKDVRGPEGWRIHVLFKNNRVVSVSHTRREQSVDANNKFWYKNQQFYCLFAGLSGNW